MTSDTSKTRAEARAGLLRSALTAGTLEWISVEGESMGAAIRAGWRVRVQARPAPTFGEVWAFLSADAEIVVHRCIGRRGTSFRFRGDAAGEDAPVAVAALVGRAIEVDDGRRAAALGRWRGVAIALRLRLRSDLGPWRHRASARWRRLVGALRRR